MRRIAAAAPFSLFALTACPSSEYEMAPQWERSLLDRYECDVTVDAAAAAEDRPVAVCDASNLSIDPIRESFDLYGSGSYDPNGGAILAYDWSLVDGPAGSAIDFERRTPDVLGLSADLVGHYTVQLVVLNDQCIQSEPCTLTIEALPDEDLWIELTWEHPGDDMDLHLLRAGASQESNGDCYYGNCVGGGPDWGVFGDDRDDPRLDLDDIPGTGPENINVYAPEDGTYTVAVHDFPGSEYWGENEVTVRIFVTGEKVYEETKTIRGEDDFVPFADVQWPSGAIRPR